jgi:hypothetical protein
MIPLWNKRRRNQSRLPAIVWLCLSGLLAASTPQSPTGGVGGTIRLIVNDHTVPLAGATVTVSNVSSDSDQREAVTDKAGRYAMDLPEGTYKIHFAWVDGGCSIVRRAPFNLGAGEHLSFDFVTMHCPSTEGKAEIPLEEEKPAYSSSLDVPWAKQNDAYREQVIPAEPGHWPEIIVSFGKYDNQVDEIRYFPMYQMAPKDAPAATAPLPLSLPVTVTVDRYTLQAMEVGLDKKAMVFTAKGVVFISDGRSGKMGNWATLSFVAGQPILKMEH